MFEILAAVAGAAGAALAAVLAGWWRERKLIASHSERLDSLEEDLAKARELAEAAQKREQRVKADLEQLVEWVSLLDPTARAEKTWERWYPSIAQTLEEDTRAYRRDLEVREEQLRADAIEFLERTARQAHLPPPDRHAQPDDRQLAILHTIAARDEPFFRAGWDHVLASPFEPPEPPDGWSPPPPPQLEGPPIAAGRPAWEVLARRAEAEMLPLLERWLRDEAEAHRDVLEQERRAHQRRCMRHVCLAVTLRLKNLDAARFDITARSLGQDEIERILDEHERLDAESR